jgi:hypothetical protein
MLGMFRHAVAAHIEADSQPETLQVTLCSKSLLLPDCT